jgi:hypothetical protein
MRYPADPPTIEEIVTSRATPATASTAGRLRALIVVLWRAGLRICDALTLAEADLGPAARVAAGAAQQGRPPPPAPSCAASPARPAYGDALRRTNSATRTPSRWPARACR